MTSQLTFEEDPPRSERADAPSHHDALLLNIDGYEGPIDVLLDLARHQKVDLREVSILQLARQYLMFVERAKALDLDLAAEYLVMAAWLAYLKSRLLLPKQEGDAEPSAEEMAEALGFQLRRLEAMQSAAGQLEARPQLGEDVFVRGMPEEFSVSTQTQWQVGLYDLLKAYGDIRRRNSETNYDLPVFNVMSTEEAMTRFSKMLGNLPRSATGRHSAWATLTSFLPGGMTDKLYGRSALASTFTAGLELAKQGKMEIKQDGLFRPVYVRALMADES